MNHDHSYKLLFSHAEMVADLLREFVREDWIRQLDLGTLERVNVQHVSDDLRDRADDVIWRVRWGCTWLYVYLLLEFQSGVDPFMALRLQVYSGLLLQELVRGQQLPPSGKLPPVLPIVLYNGSRRWYASQDLGDLIEPLPGWMERYRPVFHYLLLDVSRYQEAELAPLRNLVAAVFRAENSRRPEDLRRVIIDLKQWLQRPGQLSLRRAFTKWIRSVLLPSRLPGVRLNEVSDLVEVESMLAERVMEWTQQWKQEGFQEGIDEGVRKMLSEERAVFLRQARKRFGSLCADKLAPLLETIDNQARLSDIGEWILDCESGDELLRRVRSD